MKCEYLIAWEDGTWTTEIMEANIDQTLPWNEEHLLQWAQQGPGLTAQYRRAVCWAIYSYPPSEQEDEE